MGRKRNFPRLNIFERFLPTFVRGDLRCVHPIARKCAREILTSAFGCGKYVLVFPGPAFAVPWPHVARLLYRSFGQSHSSWSDQLPVKAIFHLFHASFFLCASVILLTSLLLPATTLTSYTKILPLQQTVLKKLNFNIFCELCFF